ncbi:MAG TPA: ATP-binding cassette domain-containing protein, partial [Terriglobales bacterium]
MNSDFKSSPGGSSVLHVRALSKTYRRRRVPWRRPDVIAAAVDIELEVSAGQTVALIGASGSGKSTVARCVTRLEKPDTGEIWLEDREVSQLGHVELQAFRSQVQLVFQDAVTSMNPRMTAAEVIG